LWVDVVLPGKMIFFALVTDREQHDDLAILFLLLLFSIPAGLTEALCSSETIKQKTQKVPEHHRDFLFDRCVN
jgi:hypothetical protein